MIGNRRKRIRIWVIAATLALYIAFGLLGRQQFDPFVYCDAFGINCRAVGNSLWNFQTGGRGRPIQTT
jgi:hypothetical protein